MEQPDRPEAGRQLTRTAVCMSLARRRLLRTTVLGAFALSASAAFVLVEHLSETGPDISDAPPEPPRPRPLPSFSLPGLGRNSGFDTASIHEAGQPILLNIFASWCVPCAAEIPVLLRLQQHRLPIWGIAFKDRADATQAFLDRFGNPYTRVAEDRDGAAAASIGLSGVPENLLVDRHGVVQWRFAAGLTDAIAAETVLPRWRALL